MSAVEEPESGSVPTPEEMARILRTLPEDDALDIIREAAERSGGWTPELNRTGLLLLKPDAPAGEEAGA